MTGIHQPAVPIIEPVDVGKLPIRLPKIEIDYSKCTVPMWCKKCLQTCEQAVFSVYCRQMVRLRESDPREPGVYEVLAVRRHKCVMCRECVEICPEGAITITYNDTVLRGHKTADTKEEAKSSPYPLFITSKPYSFDLDGEMIALLRREFDPQIVVTKVAQDIASKTAEEADSLAREIFIEYGKQWMNRVLQLGEKYIDRTYEVLREVIDRTGELFFPLVPQRFIEIAYLSTQQFLRLPVLENYRKRLVYRVPDCYIWRLLRAECVAEVADSFPCKYGCLSALETLFQDLSLDVFIHMDTPRSTNGYCEFHIAAK